MMLNALPNPIRRLVVGNPILMFLAEWAWPFKGGKRRYAIWSVRRGEDRMAYNLRRMEQMAERLPEGDPYRNHLLNLVAREREELETCIRDTDRLEARMKRWEKEGC